MKKNIIRISTVFMFATFLLYISCKKKKTNDKLYEESKSSDLIESRAGISPSRSHGTVHETLASHGSSCLITNVLIHYGYTNFQCANNLGCSLHFRCNHFIEAILYNPFSHFTHLINRMLSCLQSCFVCAIENLQ